MLTLTTWVRIQTCEICHCCYVKNGVKITVKNSINKDQQYIYIYICMTAVHKKIRASVRQLLTTTISNI